MRRLTVSCIIVMVSLAPWFTSLAAVIPPPPKKVTLKWNYPNTANTIFTVYHTTNLTVPPKKWSFVTNTTTRSVVLPVAAGVGRHYYFVTASNTVTRLESPPR